MVGRSRGAKDDERPQEAEEPKAGPASDDTGADAPAGSDDPASDVAAETAAAEQELDVGASFEAAREVVVGEPTLSLNELATEAGLPVQILRTVLGATGWAERPAYDERDVAYASAMAQLLDVFPLDVLVRALRTRYRAMTSIVISDLSTVRDHVLSPALRAGTDPSWLGDQMAGAAETLLPLITSQLAEDYRHVLTRLLGTEALARGVQLEGGREMELAIGFVDIVGYTALSGQVDPAGLDHVLAGFEDLITTAVDRTDDVLLAKFVGDAAMLVGPHVDVLARLLLSLVDDEQRLAEAPRRAGIAAGDVLVREGDYYGPVVNLAARLTEHAYPWSLLAAEDLEDALRDEFALERISKVSISGVGDRRPFRVRPA